jgi:hypothetical protein
MALVTRRTALLSGLGAAGAAVAGGIVVGRGGGVPATMTLRLRDVVHGRPGVAPGEFPPAGTHAVPFGRIEDTAGKTVGSLESVVVPSTGGAAVLHTLSLDDGTIVALGPHDLDGPYAVVGGSGRYAGVTGSYQLQPLDDTDDEAHDVLMHLTTPEA